MIKETRGVILSAAGMMARPTVAAATNISHLTFHLDSFLSYTFILNGEKVTYTPAELFAALKDKS